VAAYGATAGSLHRMRMPGLATFAWRDGSDEVMAESADAAHDAVVDAFQRCVLPMALHTRGLQVLHASAVRGTHGVLALCGPSGTGKSTLAYGLARRPGHILWADDAVAFDATEDPVRAVPLPFSMHLRQASADYFGTARAGPSTIAADPAPLEAVFVLERAAAGEEPSVRATRLAAAGAFTAVLEHAYCFDLEGRPRRRETAEQYLDLTARVPVYRLSFRPGLEGLPAILDTIERIAAGG